MQTQALETVFPQYDEELAREGVRPEDVELRIRILGPLERIMATTPGPPQVSPAGPAVKIARLFWYKAHAEKLDPNEVLDLMADQHPIVRLTAVETIAASVAADTQLWVAPKLFHRLRGALEHQRRREPSAFLAFQLDTLLEKTAKLAKPRKAIAPAVLLNPYIAGPVIHDKQKFFGRQDVIREIKATFAEGTGTRNIILYGTRRSGKTSLLYRITDGALGDSFVSVYIDLQAVAGTSVNTFLSTIIRSVETNAQIAQNSPANSQASFAQLSSCIREALDRIQPRCLIVLFDEYEVLQDFIKEKGFARQLQSLGENTSKLLFVFAGSTKLEALKQEQFMLLLDNAKYIKISFLDPGDAYRLITEPVKDVIRFADGVIDYIQEHCSGHAFYTQSLCQSIFEIIQGHGVVTVEHVEQAVRKFMENPAPHLILGWNALDLGKKIVLSALADLQVEPDSPALKRFISAAEIEQSLKTQDYPVHIRRNEIQEVLSALHEQDWITKKERAQRYRFTMRLVQRWVGEHRSIWNVLTEHRKSLTNYIAQDWMRALAATIDFVGCLIFGIVLIAIRSAIDFFGGAAPGHWVSLLVVIYFSIPMIFFSATPAMLLLGIRVRSEVGGPLSFWRKLSFGVLRSSALFFLVNMGFFHADENSVAGWACLAATVLIVGLHGGLVIHAKSRRGLFEKLVGAVVIQPPRERQ